MIENFLDYQDLLKSCHTEGPSAINLGHATSGNLLEQLVLAEMLGRRATHQRLLVPTDSNAQ